MRPSLFPTHAFFFKALFIFPFLILTFTNSYSQAGSKWATGGNSIGTGDVLGTSNNFPLLFHTNNTLKMTLSTSGILKVNNLAGSGYRLLQTDASGNITPFTMGSSTQVLYGNGVWGSLPVTPTSLWNASGSKIYYNLGNVGIGTTSPTYPLEVIGDARISNNLYVGGGIVITDKVNASSEVVTSRIQTDSIVTDSTMGFYGTTKFNGDVKLQNKLAVNGDVLINGVTSVNGNLRLGGNLTFITLPPIALDPCIELLGMSSTGTLVQMNASADLTFDPTTSPCPEPPIVPFTWQTYGNHVNHDARWIGTIENYDFRIKTNSTQRMVVKKDGKIGIGTATPIALLDVSGSMHIQDKLEIGNSIWLGGTSTGSATNDIYTDDADLLINSNSAYNFNTIINANNNGKVQIGTQKITSGPHINNKLSVDGKIVAKEIYVTINGWADYVFSTKYKLRSLPEVEKYIAENNHLPDVPSEKEMMQNGNNLGATDVMLLKKIEELTLYMILLEKENKEIKNLLEKISK